LRRNCLLKHVDEREIEWTGKRERRCRQLLDDLKNNRRYCNMKNEHLHSIVWRTRFGRGHDPVSRHNKK
jgi:hypothetical protein